MRYFAKPSSTFVTVIAAAAVIAVVGSGSAVAGSLITSAKIKNNTIKSVDVKNNALTGTDVKTNSLTGADVADQTLSNNDISVYYAVVSATGVLLDSSGGVTTDHAETGRYGVEFPRNVRHCAYSATLTNAGTEGLTGELYVQPLDADVHGVYVGIKTSAGDPTENRPFHLIVVC